MIKTTSVMVVRTTIPATQIDSSAVRILGRSEPLKAAIVMLSNCNAIMIARVISSKKANVTPLTINAQPSH